MLYAAVTEVPPAVADMTLLGIRRYDSKQLLSVLGSAAKLGFDDDMLMDTISSRLLKNIETLDAAQLVDLVKLAASLCSLLPLLSSNPRTCRCLQG